jgi:hypothetical protein
MSTPPATTRAEAATRRGPTASVRPMKAAAKSTPQSELGRVDLREPRHERADEGEGSQPFGLDAAGGERQRDRDSNEESEERADEGAGLGVARTAQRHSDRDREGAEEDAGQHGEEDDVHSAREGRRRCRPPLRRAQAGVLTRSGTLSR